MFLQIFRKIEQIVSCILLEINKENILPSNMISLNLYGEQQICNVLNTEMFIEHADGFIVERNLVFTCM